MKVPLVQLSLPWLAAAPGELPLAEAALVATSAATPAMTSTACLRNFRVFMSSSTGVRAPPSSGATHGGKDRKAASSTNAPARHHLPPALTNAGTSPDAASTHA